MIKKIIAEIDLREVIRCEDAEVRLRSLTNCSQEQAHQIVFVLGADAAHAVARRIAEQGITFDQIRDVFREIR